MKIRRDHLRMLNKSVAGRAQRYPPQVPNRKTHGKAILELRKMYGTLDYIAQHVFSGEEELLIYARLAALDEPKYGIFLKEWEEDHQPGRSLPSRRTMEELARDCGLGSVEFTTGIVRACLRRNIDISEALAGMAHPKVVERNIKEAMKAKGVKDREMFLSHTGWLPQPKGAQVNTFINAQAQANASAGSKSTPTPLPDFEEQAIEGSKISRRE
jgi:hypothetical protein